MKSNLINKLLIILVHCSIVALCSSYYTVIAPGYLKSNRKYAIAVTLHEAPEQAAVRISIVGPDFDESQKVFLESYETKLIEFQIPKITGVPYKLIAEGISGVVFKNETELIALSDAGPHIYVQTDKKIYKPKDLVQFRVVVVDEHTKPLALHEPIRVEILDADDNRVKQFKDIHLIKGVFTGELQLSEYPVLGDWKIKTTISGRYSHTRSSSFTIQKYILPKFSVNLECPKYLIADGNQKLLKIFVNAKYTYGKYVKGYAQIKLSVNTELKEKEVNISTIAAVDFDLSDVYLQANYPLYITATFTEKHTGKAEAVSCRIPVHSRPFDIKIDTDNIKLRNGIPFKIKAQVRYWNDTAVVDTITPMHMFHGSRQYEAYLNDQGEATFEFEHDSNANHRFSYGKSEFILANIYTSSNLRNRENPHSPLRLKLLGKKPKLGEVIQIEISSSESLPYFVYTLVSHGDIIRTGHIVMSPKEKMYILKIKPTIEMVPSTILYVHYIQNGRLLYGEGEIELPRQLENEISILAPSQVEPGTNVTLEINAQSGSYVCLLAVDMGVYLLDSTYDIYYDNVLNDLYTDITRTPGTLSQIYPGILSGLITLTNAHFPHVSFEMANMYPYRVPGFISKIRTKFPETWIFKNLVVSKEKTLLTLNIPETITTWRITAFSVNEQTGLGIIKQATNITTFQKFFISLNLPYSVKRGELIAVPVTIFNYFNQNLNTEVTMINEKQEYNFVGTTTNNDQHQTKSITVPANGEKTVPFLINPQKVGEIMLFIVAKNSLASDGLKKELKVEPEGVLMSYNQATYISLTAVEQNLSSSFIPIIPKEIVPDSEYITLSVSGDILVPTLENLNSLVRLPTGCGEQNMIKFAPNILALDYLKATRQYSKKSKLVKMAKNFIERGYQQELSYRHRNGGFSVFGEKYEHNRRYGPPSTWLTAYVVRFFIKASRYIVVEERIIESGLKFLISKQLENGEFPNTGYLFDPAHQNRYGLTAYILQSFMEKRKYATKYKTTIDKGLQFLLRNFDYIEDLYSLSIVASTLRMAKNNKADEILQRLAMKANGDNVIKWWSENSASHNRAVEITSYVALALSEGKTDVLPIFKWLLKQRNSQGGFKSTHDTVVGLQAMVKISQKYNNINSNLKISFTAKNNQGLELKRHEFLVNQENSLILQKEELPKDTRHISYEASGIGTVLLQLSYHFNINDVKNFKNFHIQTKVQSFNENDKEIQICFEYLAGNIGHSSSSATNMVIMELNLPSGYRSQAEDSSELLENDLIQRIESKNEQTTIILYFDNLAAKVEHCLNIEAECTHEVENLKPAAILMYDYYNTTRQDTVFYRID